MVQPENAHTNLFKVGNYPQIAYRLFVHMTPNPDRIFLSQAEWTIRRTNTNALVYLRNGELWTFSLDDSTPPAPNEKYDLKETSMGLFLPSTLASGDMAQQAPYGAFIAAVRQMILQGVMGLSLFVPFGTNSVISVGRILHIDPVLTPNGDLFCKAYYETTALVRLQRNDDVQLFNQKVFLAPSSVVGEFIEPCSPPNNVAQFCQMLETTTCVDFTSSTRNYKFKHWIRVRLENGRMIAWPLELCYWQPAAHKKDSSEFAWFGSNDVFGATEKYVSVIAAGTKQQIGENHEHKTDSQKSQGYHQAQQNNQNSQNQQNASGSNPNVHPAAAAAALASQPDVYPTPPDAQSKRGQDLQDETGNGDENWAVTPGGGLTQAGWGDDGMEDGDLFGDEEITEADFNFFDQPEPHDDKMDIEKDLATVANDTVQKDGQDTELTIKEEGPYHGETKSSGSINPSSATTNSTNSSNLSTMQFTAETMKPLPNSVEDEKRKGMFAPLKFNPIIAKVLDSKYAIGGRFYVPDPSLEDEEDEKSSSEDEEMEQAPQPVKKPETEVLSKKRETDYSMDWISILTSNADTVPDPIESTMEPPTPAGISNYDYHINLVMQQIVWDDGMLADFVPPISQLKSPDYTLVKRLSSFFPGLEKFSLKRVMLYSDSTSMAIASNQHAAPVASRIGTPRLDGGGGGSTNGFTSGKDDDGKPATPQSRDDDESGKNVGQTNDSATGGGGNGENGTNTTSTNVNTSNNTANSTGSNIANNSSATGSAITTTTTATTTTTTTTTTTPTTNTNTNTQTISGAHMMAHMEAKKPTSSVFPIEVPFYTMARNQQNMKARAPILRFWKVFGLSPKHGQKNLALTVFAPSGLAKSSSASAFANFLKTTYEGSGLGEMSLVGLQDCGIVPYDADDKTDESAMEGLRVASNKFGTTFLEKGECRNLTVLIITPFHQVASLIPIARVFSDLCDLVQNSNSKVNMGLQIVQADKISAMETIVMPSQYKMARLCLNLYDKCTTDRFEIPESTTDIQRIQPAFTLARLPSKIQLKFNPVPSKSLMDEDTLMHVAYSISNDKRWLSVAWTDQWGDVSKVEAVSLRRAGSRPRASEQVFAEIWDKTLALMGRIPVKWRVALAKVGKMTEEEVQIWTVLAEGSSNKVNFFYFLSVDINPSTVIAGDSNLFPHGKFQRTSGNKRLRTEDGTPITPQRAEDSPDMYSIATPGSSGTQQGHDDKSGGGAGNNSSNNNGGENDDAVIVDVLDSTYGVVIHSQIGVPVANNQQTGLSAKGMKPLITGYLLKPGKPGEQEQRLLEVSLIHCPTSLEGSMKSLLQHYRRLASLGGYTGVSQASYAIVPWHVEAVDKMQRVLVWIE